MELTLKQLAALRRYHVTRIREAAEHGSEFAGFVDAVRGELDAIEEIQVAADALEETGEV